MYKSPRPSGGGSGFLMLLLVLWGAFYLAGCADVATSPAFDEFEDLPSSTVEFEDLDLTIDPDIVTSVILDIESELGPNPSAVALKEVQDAVGLLQAAQVEYTNGNFPQVQVLGEAARNALSRSLLSEVGTVSIDDRIARIDNLRASLQAGDTQGFAQPDELANRLSELVDQANDARRVGDDVLAGALTVEADQRTDRSRGRQHDRDRDRDRDRGRATDASARLAVAMANTAVQLASRLLDGRDVSARQLHLLEAAARLAAGASEALEAGRFRAAAMLGHKAVNTSLWAVVAPEVTEDEVRMVKDLAEEMLEAARAALAASPDEALQLLLSRAVAGYEFGLAKLEAGDLRGISLLWKAAVVGAVIAG
ncbi:MAG: hypothetical protein BMS9Abin29_0771 [Gemmatimonadota bacterium]|nr:MAG: hypothetical protein BMS9Abin29_0771 [Gemmatimonadota bacterium]